MKASELIHLLQRIQSHTGNPETEIVFWGERTSNWEEMTVVGNALNSELIPSLIREDNPPKAGIKIGIR